MPAITYSDFSGGLDRRLPINVQEASRLWVLRNAFVTNGKKIKKRPGLRLVSTAMSGVFGLKAIGSTNTLAMFKEVGAAYSPPVLFGVNQTIPQLDPPPAMGGSPLARIHYADYFQGSLYVVAGYANGLTWHHYLDGVGTTYVADVNCPQTISVTKAASRIFAINGETVHYCAAGDAEDWTTTNDAGFLATSLQQDNRASATAVGTFQDALVVMFSEGAQIWDVAVDPSANKIRKRLFGVGTDSPLSLASFANDLVFLSYAGFRSMTVAQLTDRIDDTDVGVPVDSLVAPDLKAKTGQVLGIWLPGLGQYWAIMDMGATSKVWAYTFSKSSKIACWSEYTLPIRVTDVSAMNGRVFLRTVDHIYEVVPDAHTDNAVPIEVEVQMAFQDAKTPGVGKQFWGADVVLGGSWDLSYKYDPRDQTKETLSQAITGDTRPGDVVPVEIMVPAIAPVFRHDADEPAEIDALTLFYETLGVPGG